MPSRSPGRIWRVVCDTDSAESGILSTKARASEVLPAPDGADRMIERSLGCGCESGFDLPERLLNVLNLLAHLLDQDFKVDGCPADARIGGLGAECVRFTIQFLHQEV